MKQRKSHFKLNRGGVCHFGSMYDFHMLHVSHFEWFYSIFLLFFFFIQLGAWRCIFGVMHIYEMPKLIFFIHLHWLFQAPFMNNLSVPLFYECFEYEPSFPELNVPKSHSQSLLIPFFGACGIMFRLVVVIRMLSRELRWRRWWSNKVRFVKTISNGHLYEILTRRLKVQWPLFFSLKP